MIAIVLTVLLMIAVSVQRNVTARRAFTTVTGKGRRLAVVTLGGWRIPAAIAAFVYFMLAVLMPVGALAVSALQTSPYLSDLRQLAGKGGLSIYPLIDTATGEDFLLPLGNSLVVGLLAAGLGTALCFSLAYTANRTTARGRGLLEHLAMLPLAVPAIVLGLGLLWTWLTLPVPVYGTLAVLVIACLAVFLPQGYRSVSSSIMQLDRDLEDSAVMLGAHRPRAVLAVTIPLLRVGLSSTFLLLLMLSMRELTAVLFLFTTDTRLLSIAIFDAYDNGSLQAAAEISLLYSACIAILAVIARRVGAPEES
jgi:iron(III) transport system permease protein